MKKSLIVHNLKTINISVIMTFFCDHYEITRLISKFRAKARFIVIAMKKPLLVITRKLSTFRKKKISSYWITKKSFFKI